jgi:molybdopterin-guanine dinucleotide biosynthesis protein A
MPLSGVTAVVLAVAHDGTRMQPVFALLERSLLPSQKRFLVADGRIIDQWYAQHRLALADFSHQPNAYTNVNTPEDLAQMSQMLGLSRTRREAADPWSP